MKDSIMNILTTIDGWVWGLPLIIFIMGTGILLTVRLGVLQFRYLGRALNFMVKNEEDGEGEVSSFGALMTAMAATVGTGNIVGVATAITAGGPGALFWMVLAACFGMATKYAEGLLAVKYRILDEDGHALGGPFYYIERGMGAKWKWLAVLFAGFGMLAGLLGTGTMTQINGIAYATKYTLDPNNEHMISIFGHEYSIAIFIVAAVVGILSALVIIGGLQRIAKVTTYVVPLMSITYVAVCVLILIFNAKNIPTAISDVFASAFGLRAVGGGMLGAMIVAMQKGVARGIFSNEAGLGSAPIAAAAAKTKEPVRQGLVSMTGTFIDTIVMCSMTGLTIIVTGSIYKGLEGAEVTANAFAYGVPFWSPQVGSVVLMACLSIFAFTTILGWDYYGERCLEYIVKDKKGYITVYRWLYILAVFIGPFIALEAVWTIADIFNGLMAIPNLIALIALSSVVVKETNSYFERHRSIK